MLKKLRKLLFYLFATVLVLVALGVGAMRLAMPQLPEYRDEIQARMAEALNGDVRFDRIDARWRWRGPEILFDNVVLGPSIQGQEIEPIRIETLAVGVSFSALAFQRTAVIRHIVARGVVATLERDEAGWILQNHRFGRGGADKNLTLDSMSEADLSNLPFDESIDVRISDVSVVYTDRLTGRDPLVIDLTNGRVELDDDAVTVESALRRRDGSQSRIDFFANGRLTEQSVSGLVNGSWRAHADLNAISADLAHAFLPPDWRLPRSGLADLAVDIEWEDGRPQAASVVLDAASLTPPDGGEQSQVSGRAELTRTDTGWLCAVDDFIVGVADRSWPAASMRLSLNDSVERPRIEFDVANMTVYDLPYLSSFLPQEAARTVLESRLSGTIVDGDGFLEFDRVGEELSAMTATPQDFELNLDYVGLSVAPVYGLPGFSNLTGTLRMTDETGSLTLDSQAAEVSVPALFADTVAIDELAGTLIWRRSGEVVSVVSDAVRMRSRSLDATATLEIDLDTTVGVQTVDVDTQWSLGDVNDAKQFFPVAVMHPKLVGWLTQAVESGRIVSGDFKLSGPLAQFPFADGGGVFRASAVSEDIVLRYAREWPRLEGVRAVVELDGLSLSTRQNSGMSGNIPFRDANVRFDDLTSGELLIDTEGEAPLADLQGFAASSPIEKLLGGQIDRMQLGGNAKYEVSLRVPLKRVREFVFDAELETEDGTVALDYLPFGLSEIDGVVRFDRKGAYADAVEAELMGAAVEIDVMPAEDESGLLLEANGTLVGSEAVRVFQLPIEGKVDGTATFDARLKLPKRSLDDPEPESPLPVALTLETDLDGISVDLPYPVGKPAGNKKSTTLSLSIAQKLEARMTMAPAIDVVAEFEQSDTGPLQFDRATIHLGAGEALRSSVPGLFVDGSIDRLRLSDWLALRGDRETGIMELLQSVAVEVGDLYLFGQRIRDVSGTLQRSGEDWLIDVQGPTVSGTVSMPSKLDGSDPVVLDMRRVALLESDPLASGEVDPRQIPAIRLRAESFALGEREFGVLEAEIDRVEGGLQANSIATASDAFTVTATGSWLADETIEAGSITRLEGILRSSSVGRMMAQLGYAPGIGADSLESVFDVSWDGGPGTDFLESLDGDAKLKISDGTLEELDPGAGRVVGLLSLVELPRRLSLDFSDVFRKGFTFEEIAGDFRMVNGDAFTCNLALRSPAADVGVIGRASLFKRNYNQTAVISVKVGNTLPAVGAVVAGPQVGAALLLFSQIFKKPLKGMTEVYYQINGSWDEPSIDRTNVDRFVATSDLAGCLLDTDNRDR
ncbi:MAG: YhdP family protein [Pseudomonadota bacterium]